MKAFLLTLTLLLSYDFANYGPVSGLAYDTLTDCNGYNPLSLNFYSLECDL